MIVNLLRAIKQPQQTNGGEFLRTVRCVAVRPTQTFHARTCAGVITTGLSVGSPGIRARVRVVRLGGHANRQPSQPRAQKPKYFHGEIDMEPFIGQILLLPYNFAPKGWSPCNGQLLPIAQNQALFSLLGTNFGGDGRTTFALPTLAGPGAGLSYYIALQGIYPSRN